MAKGRVGSTNRVSRPAPLDWAKYHTLSICLSPASIPATPSSAIRARSRAHRARGQETACRSCTKKACRNFIAYPSPSLK